MSEPYPQNDEWTEDDDQRWLSEQERLSSPLSPEEDFDAWFELWQDGAEDAHVRQVLATLEAQGRRMMARAAARDESLWSGTGARTSGSLGTGAAQDERPRPRADDTGDATANSVPGSTP